MSTPLEAAASNLPSVSEEAWRYSPLGELDLLSFHEVSAPPAAVTPSSLAGLPDATAAEIVVIDGHVVRAEVNPGWEQKGLSVSTDAVAQLDLPEEEFDGLDQLHVDLGRGGIEVTAASAAEISDPVVIRYLHTGNGAASSSLLRINAGEGSTVSVFEHHASLDSSQSAGLSLPRTEFIAGSQSHIIHTVVQDLDHFAWQIGRTLATVGEQALVSSGMAAFGGHYARVRTDVTLAGRSAKGELVGVYFADGDQILDFRGFQHHSAPDTQTDMLFKGTVDDRAGSIYTGLIHIHEEGAGSNADQTNRAVKLSDDAWAWSVPNLEINNNDVKCSHASTVSPVDPEQRFYLHARGVPPAVSDRLILAGFFNGAIDRLPLAASQEMCREKIATKLDARIQE